MRWRCAVLVDDGGLRDEAGRPTHARDRRVRVLSVPSGHSYPLRLRATGEGDGAGRDAVKHLDDPVVPGRPAGQWWPPAALDPSWPARHAGLVDVVHLHFGFDHVSPSELQAWTSALRRQRVPLVFTVHDLVNPHFVDQREHRARLDVLVPSADAVLTLTVGAAAVIERRWSRTATVMPHPHVAPDQLLGAPRRTDRERWVVGLHLKGLRANIAATSMLDGALKAVDRMPGATLRVDLNAEVWDSSHPRHDATLVRDLRALQAAGRIDLRVHETFTDDELFDYLRQIDVSLLPYAFGTHSGWVELCHDLGTVVVAPRTGFWVEQRPQHSFGWLPGGRPDVADLAAALQQARTAPASTGADRGARIAEQVRVSEFHDDLYLRLSEIAQRERAS